MVNMKETVGVLFILILNFYYTTTCNVSLSAEETEWAPNPTDVIDIEWMFGHSTCSSQSTCYGVSGGGIMRPQMAPLETQYGQPIRFIPSDKMGISFSLLPLYVNEQDFQSCSQDEGILVIDNPSSHPINVHQKFLPIGSNYFIVQSSDPFMRCDFGLRVNVTVKENHCHSGHDDIICSGHGKCVSRTLQHSYTCRCCAGWTGEFCQDIDACLSSPCLNDGQCHDVLGDTSGTRFTCTCALGFHGDMCHEQYSDLCDLQLCQHSRGCVGNSTHYRCQCMDGYTGPQCEARISSNSCEPNPCEHGICVESYGGTYQCYCRPGYGGYQCERDYNECQSSPCYHGGSCHDDENGYSCVCTMGYTGPRCETKVDLCSHEPCYHSGSCVDYGDTYGCHCVPGFTGRHCKVDIDDCQSKPCLNEGTCFDRTNGYQCMCSVSWKGSNCQYKDEYRPRTSIFNTRGHLSPGVLAVILCTVSIIIIASIVAGCFLYWRNNNFCRRRNRKIIPFILGSTAVSKNAVFDCSADYDENRFNTPLFTNLKRKV